MKSSGWLRIFFIAILALSTAWFLPKRKVMDTGAVAIDMATKTKIMIERITKSTAMKAQGYDDRDHETMHGWYEDHRGNLPPGLAKKDPLPPVLERQLELRGTLPPDLRGRVYAVAVDLERELPPPPPNCAAGFIGGHVVLLNRRTFVVVDVFHRGSSQSCSS